MILNHIFNNKNRNIFSVLPPPLHIFFLRAGPLATQRLTDDSHLEQSQLSLVSDATLINFPSLATACGCDVIHSRGKPGGVGFDLWPSLATLLVRQSIITVTDTLDAVCPDRLNLGSDLRD